MNSNPVKALIQKRVTKAKEEQKTCGCIGTSKAVWVGGPNFACEHYSFAVVFPEFLEFWKDDKDPKISSPCSNKEFLMACKAKCGCKPYMIPLKTYIINLGCDGCKGRGKKVQIPFERSIAANERMMKLWNKENKADPRNICQNDTNKYMWKCSVNLEHEWPSTPNNMYRGSDCPKCPPKSLISREEMERRFQKARGKDKYEYDWKTYKTQRENMAIKCKKHDETFWQRPDCHIRGDVGCKICPRGNTISKEEMEIRFRTIWKDRYEYDWNTYRVRNESMSMKCREHDEIFWQTPSNHLLGNEGCEKCPNVRIISREEMEVRFMYIWGDKYEYDWNTYRVSNEKMAMKCTDHSQIFWQTPTGHQAEHEGCPKCQIKSANSKGVMQIMDFLDELEIPYKTEETFDDLRGKESDTCYRFDFRLFLDEIMIQSGRDLIIERDGQQHFKSIECRGGQEAFEEGQKRDIIKDQYIINKGFNLIRIPYWIRPDQVKSLILSAIDEIFKGNKVYYSYAHYSQHTNHSGYMYKEHDIPGKHQSDCST